jgi:DNA-nicking Smr family endonuclease
VPNAQSGVEFEAATTVEDMKAATALRGRARRSNREMREARDLAKSARKRGDQTAAERHRRDAIAHESEMKSLDKRAAKIIFRENNKARGRLSPCRSHAQSRSCQALTKGTVDLHGLYVAEAMECAKKELESATCRNDDEICFIVGKSFSDPCGVRS